MSNGKGTAPNASLILGINSAYHESSAALVVDGRLVAAVEEERFSGRKHGKALRVDNAHHLPLAAIDYCLREAAVSWRDLDAVAYSLDPALRLRHARLGRDGPHESFGHPLGEELFRRSLAQVPRMLRGLTAARFHYVPHHICHAWYALGTSPFERAAVLVMDGIGEGATLSLGQADRRRLEIYREYLFPHSVGLAWEKVACFLGLTEYDACKVMALAGLQPSGRDDALAPHLRYGEQGLEVSEAVLDLEHPLDYSGLERLFGRSRQDVVEDLAARARIAAALQRATQHLLLDVARDLHTRSGEPSLAYAGGVALNCRANAVLAEQGPFERLHIGPAAHDAGTAVGAAWHVYTAGTGRPVPLHTAAEVAASGPRPSTPSDRASTWRRRNTQDTLAAVAGWLVSGEAVGWLESRCELGPRALGRRSLLASPLPSDVVHRINRLKGRYEFEPLALAVPEERADEIFDIPPAGRGLTPYMLLTVRPRAAWRGRLAQVLHADGTVRLQTVAEDDHPALHALLQRLEADCGVPLLVNTSFNPRGRPMPATAVQAVPLAERLGIRRMVIDDVCWLREHPPREAGGLVTAAGMRWPELVLAG